MAKFENLIDVQCERAVIGSLLREPSCFSVVSERISDEAFTLPTCRVIFKAINTMIDAGRSVDVFTVNQFLCENPPAENRPQLEEIMDLSANVVTTANVGEHAAILQELSARRKLLTSILQLEDDAADMTKDIADSVQEAVEQITASADTPLTHIETAGDAVRELHANVKKTLEGKNVGVPTGLVSFDERGGLRPSHLTVIGAYSGQGKSAIARQMAARAAAEGFPVAFYTLEMSKAELMARAVAAEAGINVATILNRPQDLTEKEWNRYYDACAKIGALPIFFDERATSSLEDIITSARSLCRRRHIKGIFIDYLQILNVTRTNKGQGEEAFLASCVRQLKNLAKRENIFVVLLSQLSRNHEHEEPSPDYLRGSGQILEGCDNLYLIFRPEVKGTTYVGKYAEADPEGTAQIQVCKCRNGQSGQKYLLGFCGEQTKFYELTHIPKRNNLENDGW